MGLCLLACFLVCKPRKLQHLQDQNDHGDEKSQLTESEKEKHISPIRGLREKIEDQKVSFDLNVKTKDDDLAEEKEKLTRDRQIMVHEEFSDSLFSLSIDSRKQVCAVELGEKEVNSPMPKCGDSFFSSSNDSKMQLCEVETSNPNPSPNLQPVANIGQWQGVKSRTTQSLQKLGVQEINGLEPSSKLLESSATESSSWLASSERTSMSSITTNSGGILAAERTNSATSLQDSPNFGASRLEQVEQHSASASPKQFRKAPVLGTVGSYWIYTGQIKDPDKNILQRNI